MRTWWAANPGVAGAAATVAGGFELGRRIFGGLLVTRASRAGDRS
ncbi:MAG: hypothetical protein HY615_16480 [Candidatus Rokubacteria bacterium]|nr:hypothetical protein [Candidatus Rokubacteria bacterium]